MCACFHFLFFCSQGFTQFLELNTSFLKLQLQRKFENKNGQLAKGNRNRMGFKSSIVLIHFLMITVPIGQLSEGLYSVRASKIDVNETQSKIRKITTITTATATIVSDTCNDRFCYSQTNETAIGRETIPSYKEYDQLKTSSILYGLAQIATERGQQQQQQQNQCSREMKKIYDGIHRKEIWAIKGSHEMGCIFLLL